MNQVAYISMKNIVKTFGKVVASNHVNFSVHKGEIHALLGENGAGKSTLMNMLSGIYLPDGGSIFMKEKKYISQRRRILLRQESAWCISILS